MNYPFWDTGVSYGVLMASISIFHVFISHFAIGGGLYLVLTEHWARARHHNDMLIYLKKLSRFFILLTLVTGALTGVAIWFIIGLLNPMATQVLIRHFVWGWAIEWVFFFVEIAAAILYYYGWGTIKPRAHLTLGWIYFAAAYLSLVIINGIITFMLTPGEWLTNGGEFWSGFFNPTYWPSLVMRTGITIAMAGLFTMFVAAKYEGDIKTRCLLQRYNAAWGLVGVAIASATFLFWYKGAILGAIDPDAMIKMTIPAVSSNVFVLATMVLAGLLAVLGLAVPRACIRLTAAFILVVGFTWFGSFEWFRESVRKPWAVNQVVYGNGLLAPGVPGAPDYEEAGLLGTIELQTRNPGADLYRRACASCHTLSGYNGLKDILDGTDTTYIKHLVMGAHAMRGNMPPFLGTEEEAELITEFIARKLDLRPLEEYSGLQGKDLGYWVYRKRCGTCHVQGGYQDITGSFPDIDLDFLDTAEDMADEMPPFTGTETQAKALLEYFASITEESQ